MVLFAIFKKYEFLTSLIIFCLFTSCVKKEDVNLYIPTKYNIAIPRFLPTTVNIPSNNPLTVEGIALGRFLFYDGRLSGRIVKDSLMSCSTCHIQQYNFRTPFNHKVFIEGQTHGLTGVKTNHIPLPLVNLIWNNNAYNWNGSIYSSNSDKNSRNIEDIVTKTITMASEINGDTSMTVATIQSIKGYSELFKKAFGSSKVTMLNISKAISQFVRTLISANSKFDKYLRGEEQLTDDELSGFILFTTEEGADCFHCHGSSGNPLFTTNLFYNNGKDTIFNDKYDRFSVTKNIIDKGAYKAPTLRNIMASGGPYMHDGRFKNIDEVINFYSHKVLNNNYIDPLMHHVNNGGVQLTFMQKNQLKVFLSTLTDYDFLTNQDFAAPDVFPDGVKYIELHK